MADCIGNYGKYPYLCSMCGQRKECSGGKMLSLEQMVINLLNQIEGDKPNE